jgi:hypothetical protein
MAFLTKEQVRNAARRKTGAMNFSLESARVLNEHMEGVRYRNSYDIFLSHAHEDADIMLGIVEILKGMNYSVYVDWLEDRQLDRTKVTPAHADLLRKRMQQSKFLLYVTTSNSPSSKWMPWELGYFDGRKPDKVGVLPVLDYSHSSFIGQEFIGLYPTVEYSELSNYGQLQRKFIWKPKGYSPTSDLRESI